MSKICDLHTHSHYSDGTFSPTQIIDNAVALNLTAVALTDHNTVAGLPEFLDAAKGKNITAIPGIEISTGYNGKELHIVGLFLNPNSFDQITEYLSIINIRKEESNKNLIHVLNKAGYTLNYDEIKSTSQGNVNRAVIAAALLEKGFISEIKEAFNTILSENGGYYIPPKRIVAFEAIEFLKSIHAVPVLAHPFLNLTEDELSLFLSQAKPYGLAAMETHYSTYSPETTSLAIKIAEQHNILQSGGSDFHGENKPDIQLGFGKGSLAVPDYFAKELENYKASL